MSDYLDIFFSIIGGLLETFLIIIIGYTLVGIAIKDKLFSLLIVSLYGSIVLTLMKAHVPIYIYLVILILTMGFILTFIINVNLLISVLGLLFGVITLFLSEFLSFLFLLPVQIWLNIELNKIPILLLATPHLLIMIIIFFVITRYNIHLYRLSYSTKNINYKVYLSLVILFGLLFVYYSIYLSNKDSFYTVFSAIIIFTVTTIVFYLIRFTLKSNLEVLTDTINTQYEQDFSTYINNIKRQRHDFIHHLFAIKKMLDNGMTEESKCYLNEVLEETSSISEVLPLYSDAVGGMLLSYKELANKRNIEMYITIRDNLKNIPCRVYEINKILGNLILNSFEAVDSLELCKKHINVHIGKSYKHYYFEVSNFTNIKEFEKNLPRIFNPNFTSKNGLENEGQGLPIINSILDKYKGYIYPKIYDDTVVFTVIIPFGGSNAEFNA